MGENKNFKELLADVEAIVFDVDGVMTDGGIMPLADGDFIRKYNAKDGYALAYAASNGFKIGVISGGFGKTLESRMNRLHIEHTYLGCMDKIAALHDFAAKTGVNLKNAIYMGDDIPDYEVMKRCGCPCCPADAAPEIKEISLYISHRDGGYGCGRDVVEQVLRAQSKWMQDAKAFGW